MNFILGLPNLVVRDEFLLATMVFQVLYHFYRPQRSCGKVMFLQLSVILFTGGSATSPLGRHPPRQTARGQTVRHPPAQGYHAGIQSTSGW